MNHGKHQGGVLDLVLLFLVNLMWAAQYSAYKAASSQIPPVALSAWTFLIAALVLWPFHWVLQARRSPRLRSPRRPALRELAVLGVLGLIPASACLAWGTGLSTASNASLLYLTVPLITAFLAACILRESITVLHWVSLALSIFGVLLISEVNSMSGLFRSRYAWGNLLVLVACASSSFYNVYSKKLLQRFSELDVLIRGYVLAALVSLPFIWWREPTAFGEIGAYRASTWISLVVLGVMSWGIAMLLWMHLLKRLEVSRVSVSIYLLPVLGVVVAALTLGERISLRTICGGLITLAGTAIITLWDRAR